MKYNIQRRFVIFYVVLSLVFFVMIAKIMYLTVFSEDVFSKREASFIYKKIEIKAPRGEIRDRNGRLLAGNRPSFNVQVTKDTSVSQEDQNKMFYRLSKILRTNEEMLVDEFPIKVYQGYYYFIYDEELRKWKEKNNLKPDATAEESFSILANLLSEQGVIRINPEDTAKDIQQKMIEIGYYPPISVKSELRFIQDIKKEEWMERTFGRGYKDHLDKSAQEIFKLAREVYGISDGLDEKSARDVMILNDLLRSRRQFQYQPINISFDIGEKTVIQLEEETLNLPMVSIVVEPVRYYPYGEFTSHILGYLGKIGENETDYYVKEKGYDPNEIIGKTGLEKAFEEKLRGRSGYRIVQVDVKNRMVQSLGFQAPIPGETVYITTDNELQQVVEDSLKKTLNSIQTGSSYTSNWGDIKMRDTNKVFNKAKSGATVVLDVKSGEVLAMASYPDYDPNKFVLGISQEEYEKLMPENINDSMAPKPLYNISTMMSVQPGSTFKMITGLAGLENGLDPYYRIQDKGFIEIGQHKFGCWIWNSSNGGRTHGKENLIDAIRDSCNYYMYCLSVGYDYSKDVKMNVEMNSEKILDYAKRFGLDEKTGIEIEETKGQVPNVGIEKEKTLKSLSSFLNKFMEDKFEDVSSGSAEYTKKIETITSWSTENPGRGELIRRLSKLSVKKEHINTVADRIKYDYFNTMSGWKEGDAFNLAIGQGAHSYTPIQLARYIAALANDGVMNEVTVVNRTVDSEKRNALVNSTEKTPIELKNKDNLKYLVQGMINVSDEGTSKNVFKNFPVSVASKTGTAQRPGYIPTKDEKNYYLSHLRSYGVKRDEVLKLAKELEENSKLKLPEHQYIVQAILKLNKNLSSKRDLDIYKDEYDEFAWFVSFAPAENPEIAIVSVIVQGGHGGYGAPMARDIYTKYFRLNEPQKQDKNNKDAQPSIEVPVQKKINYSDEIN